MSNELYRIDGLLWQVDNYNELAIPLCPIHRIRLSFNKGDELVSWGSPHRYAHRLFCEDCDKVYSLRRELSDEEDYVVNKVKSTDLLKYDVIDIDGILTPVTKKQKVQADDGFFCTAQIRDSKRGPQVVIYAGKKGSKEKSQVFITPEERRLSFDQNDLNPADVFTKITAEFRDGTSHTIEKTKKLKGSADD